MKKITTISNSFHNTHMNVRIPEDQDIGEWWMDLHGQASNGDKNAKAMIRRIHNSLCGSKDCTCGVIRK